MKEEEQKSAQQKQMLINRLYKSKNTQNVVKPQSKGDDDTKLLFYVTSFQIYSKLVKNHSEKNKKSLNLSYFPA